MKTLVESINEGLRESLPAVKKAFPKLDKNLQEFVAHMYDMEGAFEDFSSVGKMAKYIEDDIVNMVEAGFAVEDEVWQNLVKWLVAEGYLDDYYLDMIEDYKEN